MCCFGKNRKVKTAGREYFVSVCVCAPRVVVVWRKWNIIIWAWSPKKRKLHKISNVVKSTQLVLAFECIEHKQTSTANNLGIYLAYIHGKTVGRFPLISSWRSPPDIICSCDESSENDSIVHQIQKSKNLISFHSSPFSLPNVIFNLRYQPIEAGFTYTLYVLIVDCSTSLPPSWKCYFPPSTQPYAYILTIFPTSHCSPLATAAPKRTSSSSPSLSSV